MPPLVSRDGIEKLLLPVKTLFGDEGITPPELRREAWRMDNIRRFAVQHNLRHPVPSYTDFLSSVNVVRAFLIFIARNQRMRVFRRIRAVHWALKRIVRFQAFTKSRREGRIADLVRKWKSVEVEKRDRCRRVAELQHAENLKRLAHDYTVHLVPGDLKYQVANQALGRLPTR